MTTKLEKENLYAVIIAGGVGSRFWPVSTPECPKQFHDMLKTGKSLLQQTFSRLELLIPKENIYISTNKKYAEMMIEQLNIKSDQLILEPSMQNTAPAILYSSLKIYKKNPHALILVAPSDHLIKKETHFIDQLETAFEMAKNKSVLVTLGIEPTHPHTGYGYIKHTESASIFKDVEIFTEKPDREKAEKFLLEKNYLWNAGIFVWSGRTILDSFKNHLPEMFDLFEKGSHFLNTEHEVRFINEQYSLAENISIDYGILEHSDNVKVLPLDIGWNDLGTWGSLYNELEKDEQKNAVINGRPYITEASGNMIYTQHKKKIIIKGMHNFIIVENDNTLLIIPKADEQDIKKYSQLDI